MSRYLNMRRCRNQRSRGRAGERGYVMIVFAFLTAMLVIGFYRIVPQVIFEGKRQKEEELIFRGEQYRRAIQLYVRQFGRYPTSIDDLEDSNGMRFLRKRFPDPMTAEGEWRLIHMGPGGVITDSLVLSASTQGDGIGTLSSSDEGFGDRETNDPGGLSDPEERKDPAESATANDPNRSQPRASSTLSRQSSGPTFGEGAIAGIASTSEEESIRVYNDETEYNRWEFIYDYRMDPLGLGKVAGNSARNPNLPPDGGDPQGGDKDNRQDPFNRGGGERRNPFGFNPGGSGQPPSFPGMNRGGPRSRPPNTTPPPQGPGSGAPGIGGGAPPFQQFPPPGGSSPVFPGPRRR